MSEQLMKPAILESAAKQFAENGYSAVSMRDVAGKVGTTPANIYYHFQSKEGLIQAVLINELSAKTNSVMNVLSSGEDVKTKIDKFTSLFVHLLADDSVFFRLVIRELLDGDEKRRQWLATTVFAQPFRLLESFAGELSSERDSMLTAISIISAMLGHIQLSGILRHLTDGQRNLVDPDIIATHIAELFHRNFLINSESQGTSKC